MSPNPAAASPRNRDGGRTLPTPLAVPVLLALTIAVALLGIIATGAAAPNSLVPASGLVTWGIPAVRGLHHLGLLLAVGAGGTAVLLQPGPSRAEVRSLGGGRGRTVRLAAAGAGLWALSALALVPLGGLEAAGAGTDLDVWQVALGADLGRIQLAVAILAGISALLGLLARSTVGAAWALAAAGLGVAAVGLEGHAGASLDHTNAVNAMVLHLLGVSVWAGGLLAIALIAPRLPDAELAVVVRRFSPWALAAVVVLALSGLVNASIRLDGPGELLTTAYGRVLLLKTVLLVGLAALGAAQRRRLGERLRFRHLALTEGVLLAVVIGASIALGRTAPPVPQTVPLVGDLRRLALVGYLPPSTPLDPAALVTVWHPDWGSVIIASAMAGLYLAGVVRLRRRGDAWPLLRTALWLAGCLALVWVMNGGAAAWGRYRFDAHMVQHMAMMMIVPPLWVLGGPVTLLSRAVAPRTDGSRGLREWVLAALHSGYSRIVSSPPVAGLLFAGSLVVFYFTPLFELSMRTHVGHVAMTVHFLLAGYLFAWVLIGVDPAQKPINPVLKLITLLVTLAFHAFFGIALYSATWIVAQDWYTELGLYGPAQLELIQARGASIMWAVSEIPTVLYAILMVLQWIRSEDRRARQYDRKAERDGGAELAAYNAYLAGLQGGAASDGDQADATAPAPGPAVSAREDDGPGTGAGS
ncbi:bifunctional copper resistance protein CopD/cytochrome c oxidase assembly protein [Brachybacterium sp. NBEC-018]|uniref:bifunctional copper resistance protein CopD/cytochrome c oxidase assembly protein n=1 Tax=Brachybacterium sp. NBEC-018 TaxID=2996004 RepID=UPI002174F8D6|nr:bifunctional copper resistance protein CopD/cytochrome c oxidase assembly protein [Brachybacterium sp. NBEC-018]UVY85648.1 bifunctional copper resistance protein CopD/cytochrome c oxidase assembly protein [Brachybacterium sp. NBEC-018]